MEIDIYTHTYIIKYLTKNYKYFTLLYYGVPKLTAEEITDDQIKGVQAKTGKYQTNVQKATTSFKTAALAANDKRINNLRASLDLGTWERAMNSVDENEAIAVAAKSGNALAEGVSKRRNKILRFHQKFGPIRDGIASAIRAMPQGTEADRNARVLENLSRMRASKGSWR